MRPGMPAMACWSICWINPAVTSEPPEGSSTVVSFLRVAEAGLVAAGILGGMGPVDLGHLRRQMQRDAPLRKDRRREVEDHPVRLQIGRDRAFLGGRVVGAAGGDRDGAAGGEFRALGRKWP